MARVDMKIAVVWEILAEISGVEMAPLDVNVDQNTLVFRV